MESFRRSQFIVPFGVGAIHTLKGGITVITAGLDYWFTNNRSAELADISQSNFEEFRLKDDLRFIRRLRVDYLMQPPEYRILRKGQEANEISNVFLPVPVFRFPNWHICPSCSLMQHVGSGTPGRVKCSNKECDSRSILNQTRFIVACENGCVMDFPWREWVFGKNTKDLSANEKSAKLEYKGGNSVNDISVKASDSSGKQIARRTLFGAFGSNQTGDGLRTKLSNNLIQGSKERFSCPGCQSWLKANKKNGCGRDLQPTLISASNAYFAQIKTSIFIPTYPPESMGKSLAELYDVIHKPGIYGDVDMLSDMLDDVDSIARALKKKHSSSFNGYEVDEIMKVLDLDERPPEGANQSQESLPASDGVISPEGDVELRYRYDEYLVLTSEDRDLNQIKTRQVDSDFNSSDISSKISKVVCVDRLKETRAHVGFSRIVPEVSSDAQAQASMLRLIEPAPNNNWLPATEVYGEGLFIQFSEKHLEKWERRPEVSNWAKSLQTEYDKLDREPKSISPRFLMIHTFAHILMTQMVFDCGYSSASLRERLYVSADDEMKMSGVLIYTAAGDSDGTLGGLIRLGRKDLLEPIIISALEKATWCSSDPVCAEAEFQGTDNCNKAACHNCAIVSETSCEEFNRFLDRSLVTNNSNGKNIGYFNLK